MSYINKGYQGYPYVNPIVTDAPSIDPASASRWTNLPRRVISSSVPRPGTSGLSKNNASSSSTTRPPAPVSPDDDDDDTPVLYIDVPQPDGSDVCTSIESPSESQPEFLQDTILYDPFENTRIDVPKDDATSQTSTSTDTQSQGSSSPVNGATRPNNLNLLRGTSNIQSPSTPGLPSIMQKESYVYGGHGSDGFPLSPIPISEFPEPPPAYSEMDIVATPSPTPQESQRPSETQRPLEPPRTQVIVPTPEPGSSVGVMRYNCKNLMCHRCGCWVHTLVIKENGFMTYVLAVITFIVFMPMLLCLFFTDCFKYKNHYCPNCNKLIGYQLPIFGEQIHLVAD